jgi:O-antigen ligase
MKGMKVPSAFLYACALFAFCALTLLWTRYPQTAEVWLLRSYPYLATFILVAPLCICSPAQVEKAFRVVLYFGFFILIGISFSSIGFRGVVLTEVDGKLIEGNPLATAAFGGYVALAAIFIIYSSKTSGAMFWLHLVIAAVALVTIARTGSRGQMIAVAIAAFVWLPITARIAAKRSSVSAIVISALVTIGMIYAVSQTELARRWNWEKIEGATFGRLGMAQSLLNEYADGGVGIWMFGLGSSASFDVVGFYPHIVVAEVLGEEGLIGLFLFLAFVSVVFLSGFKHIRSDKIEQSERVNLGLLMAIFTFEFMLTFKQGSLLGSSPFFGFGVCVAWYIAALARQQRRSESRSREEFRLLGHQFFHSPSKLTD